MRSTSARCSRRGAADYAAILVQTLIRADLLGMLLHPVNIGDHLLHIALAAIGIGLGWYGLNQERAVTA